MRGLSWTVLLLTSVSLGCSSSCVAPSRGVDLTPDGLAKLRREETEAPIDRALAAKPLASFPANLAVARIESSGYHSYTADGYGSGAFSVVTTRDVESDEGFERLGKLPQVRGVAPLGRLLISRNLKSDEQLREAAARLGADVLLIYTFDTTFYTDDNATPLTLITLGLSPNRVVYVSSTASAVFLDTRNGYVYGVAEATHKAKQLTNLWEDSTAADQSRRRAESAAFDDLVAEIEKTWKGIAGTYAKSSVAQP